MERTSIRRGVVLAMIAALAFGVATPIVAWAGQWVGPLTTAMLLYAGAAASAVLPRFGGHGGAPLRRSDGWRLIAVAIAGAAIAPVCLAWGLQRAGATIGALLLNLEAVFTVLLARAVYREPIGGRVALAVTAMVGGGAVLVLDASRAADWGAFGVLAVAIATAAWATDNTLTRPLAERDPIAVVAAKSVLGAALTMSAALFAHEALPPWRAALALLLCGATGYGLSLRFYLLAQRKIGAGRTGSVFALAPFIGAAIAVALGDRTPSLWTAVAAMLFGTGVYLHATERHHHRHVHTPLDHEHPHRHDDSHHTHAHDPAVIGEHTHAHHHDGIEHDHDHAPDIHHDHH